MTAPLRPARLFRTSKFEAAFSKLPKEIQETTHRKIQAMERDWTDSWLDRKKMRGYENKWRFKINGQYRLIAEKKAGDEFELEFVGTKNQVKKMY